ncbi:aminoglycoside phosphotransferase family protein [Kribbella albertanoniae]|uniref:Aminoglycoside phosphotransferase family protein n=1 Tax=Kribbella albertanoniae TaxID=1266829 RepID=A0A4R4Q2R9_9ACTN|nr:aminoglycoside phosphotransferase family protein [Kribbella albertanoniae]TDC29270.1 aminoglycoside phosphotransferase family protein [Kribbella albertanoniae]
MTNLTAELGQKLKHALKGICQEAGLVADEAELIKYTNNAVYRLPSQGVVVRFGAGDVASQRADHVTRIANWLQDHDAPAAQLTPGQPQPILFENYSATIWQLLEAGNPTWTGAELAAPLLGWHKLTPMPGLKPWDPFSSARSRLALADGLTPDDHAWLTDQWSTIEADYRAIVPDLELGLLHGDAYIGNLLREPTGRYVLCDFDGTSLGPLAYDLVVAAVSALRFGATHDHDSLATTYGVDVTTLPAWPTLRRIRELILVTSVITDLRNRPDIAKVHAHRLSTLRSGATELWHRYK